MFTPAKALHVDDNLARLYKLFPGEVHLRTAGPSDSEGGARMTYAERYRPRSRASNNFRCSSLSVEWLATMRGVFSPGRRG